MKIAYFDCIGGASGDMLLGALLDAGLPEARLRQDLEKLRLPGYTLQARQVNKNGFQAIKVDVQVAGDVPERPLEEIEALVRKGSLPEPLVERAIGIFRRLGEVEARIHGLPVEQVHLHELGGVDTIVDVVGVLAGLEALGVDQVHVSPLPLGRGFVRGAHGSIPLPAPATLALLKGAPVVGSEIERELVTPTGAALLTSLAYRYGSIPPMTLTAVGYGAGGRDLPVPNLLRLLLGEAADAGPATLETLALLESNLDDLNPEIYAHVMERLFAAGALDVFLAPVQMKKNRPGTLLSVLCRPGDAQAARQILFTETSTLGVRQRWVERYALERSIQTVATPYGPVRVKVARLGHGETKAAPEYEDCRRLASEQGVPLREVYQAAERAYLSAPAPSA